MNRRDDTGYIDDRRTDGLSPAEPSLSVVLDRRIESLLVEIESLRQLRNSIQGTYLPPEVVRLAIRGMEATGRDRPPFF